jgi:hypothetical protein
MRQSMPSGAGSATVSAKSGAAFDQAATKRGPRRIDLTN